MANTSVAARRTAGLVLAALALAILAALGALASGPAGQGERGAELEATASEGSVAHTNSRDGQSIFTGAGLGPGGSASGEVTLRNTGTLAARFTLSAADLVDVPGAGGGALSQRLRLTVTDVTAAAAPLTIYDGGLAAMGPRDVGVFAPGQERSFRFVATLPDGGDPAGSLDGDNAFQGAEASVRYVWDATEHVEPPPDVPPPVDEPPPPVVTDPPPPRRRTDEQPPRVRVSIPRTQEIFADGRVTIRLRSSEGARVLTSGWLRAGRGRMRLPESRVRIRAGNAVVAVRVPRRHRKAMLRALTRGQPATLRIVIAIVDRSGNRTVVRRTLRVAAG